MFRTEPERPIKEVLFTPRRGGSFYPGVPARNLTAAEWLALPPERRVIVEALGMYTVIYADIEEKDNGDA